MPNPHFTIADDGSGQTVGVGSSGALKVDPSAVTQPISGQISFANQSISVIPNDTSVTGNITANGQAVTISPVGASSVGVNISGSWTGTLQTQVSADGVTFSSTYVDMPGTTGVSGPNFTANQSVLRIPSGGMKAVRVAATATMTGTATIVLQASSGALGLVQQSVNVAASQVTLGVQGVASGIPLTVTTTAGTQVNASNVGNAAAAVSAVLLGTSGKTTYITGFEATSGQPVGAVVGTITINGPTPTLLYQFAEGTSNGGQLIVQFPDPIGATNQNQNVVVAISTITGGAVTALTAHGYQL